MSKICKIAISGANGFLGGNIGRYLENDGFKVLGITRPGRSIGFGSQIISKDLTEDRLISSLKGSISFLHFIGEGRQTTDSDFETVNHILTRNAVRLCKRSGIKKMIYISGLGADHNSTSGYFISKFKAEQEIIQSGLDYTIFRASYIVGGNDPMSQILRREIKKGIIRIPGSGRYRIQPIFVGDVARIVTNSVRNRMFSRKIIDLVGPKIVTYKRFVTDLVTGRDVVVKHIEFERIYHDSMRGKDQYFGVDDLGIIVGDYIGNHKRLEKISGMKLTSYDNMLQACRLS